jgi:hypothetical protein
MNTKIILLLIGLVVGGLVGFMTRPQSSEIKVGPIELNVQTNQTAAPGDPVTSGQWQHIAIFAAIGALVGIGAGYAVGGRRA